MRERVQSFSKVSSPGLIQCYLYLQMALNDCSTQEYASCLMPLTESGQVTAEQQRSVIAKFMEVRTTSR